MNATCLINSYNYRQHVGEAVRSALEQTVPFDRVVVVDDGSTDGSLERLRWTFGGEQRVEVIGKDNAGQLSCFNRGIRALKEAGGSEADAANELVFFLDADDRYHKNYLETALRVYQQRPEVDFLSVAPQPIGDTAGLRKRRKQRTRDHGITVLGALLAGQWLGERTSCLSMRLETALRVLPYPNEADWITRADDVLVFGSSAVGAFKHHLEVCLVDYRVHANNYFASLSFSDVSKMRHSLAVSRLLGFYAQQQGYDLPMLSQSLHREFRTKQWPSTRELRSYVGMSLRSRLPLAVRVRHAAAMCQHYVKQTWTSRRPAANRSLAATPPTDNPLPESHAA